MKRTSIHLWMLWDCLIFFCTCQINCSSRSFLGRLDAIAWRSQSVFFFFSSNAQKICIKEEARKFVTSLLTRGRTHITTLMLGWEIRVEYLTQLTTRQIDQSVFLLATGIAIRRRVKKKTVACVYFQIVGRGNVGKNKYALIPLRCKNFFLQGLTSC